MKNKNWIKFVSVLCALPLCLSGCGSKQEESEALLDAFLDNAVPAYYDDGERVLMFEQLPMYEEDWAAYSVGERIDLDNGRSLWRLVFGCKRPKGVCIRRR